MSIFMGERYCNKRNFEGGWACVLFVSRAWCSLGDIMNVCVELRKRKREVKCAQNSLEHISIPILSTQKKVSLKHKVPTHTYI